MRKISFFFCMMFCAVSVLLQAQDIGQTLIAVSQDGSRQSFRLSDHPTVIPQKRNGQYYFRIADAKQTAAYVRMFSFMASDAEPTDDPTYGQVTTEPSTTTVTITWPISDNVVVYTIEIKKDGKLFCTLQFNEYGQLIGMAFAPSRRSAVVGSPSMASVAVQTDQAFRFTVTGLQPGSHYTYQLVGKDSNSAVVASYTGSFNTPTDNSAVEQTQTGETGNGKFLINGQLYIMRNGNLFNVQGGRVE